MQTLYKNKILLNHANVRSHDTRRRFYVCILPTGRFHRCDVFFLFAQILFWAEISEHHEQHSQILNCIAPQQSRLLFGVKNTAQLKKKVDYAKDVNIIIDKINLCLFFVANYNSVPQSESLFMLSRWHGSLLFKI